MFIEPLFHVSHACKIFKSPCLEYLGVLLDLALTPIFLY